MNRMLSTGLIDLDAGATKNSSASCLLARSKGIMPHGWADLPVDLLRIICEKLIGFNDYKAFGVVCRSWRIVLWRCLKRIPPVLMLPNTFYTASNRYTHRFFSTTDFHIDVLPATHILQHDHCFGSSHGWLLVKDSVKKHAIQLLNPFLVVDNVIKLPSFGEDIVKVVLSENPTWTSNYLLMVIYGSHRRLALLKPGDESWTCIHHKGDSFHDVVYYKDQFYAMSSTGNLASCDVSSTKPQLTIVATSTVMNSNYLMYLLESSEDLCVRSCNDLLYLVESSEDLLCVRRKVFPRKIRGKHVPQTIGFKIYKLDAIQSQWFVAKTLRGHALFLGQNSSLSLLASEFSQGKPNHIYFTEAYPESLDMGVFNLEDQSFQLLVAENINMLRTRPIWVQPTLNSLCIKEQSCPSRRLTRVSDAASDSDTTTPTHVSPENINLGEFSTTTSVWDNAAVLLHH